MPLQFLQSHWQSEEETASHRPLTNTNARVRAVRNYFEEAQTSTVRCRKELSEVLSEFQRERWRIRCFYPPSSMLVRGWNCYIKAWNPSAKMGQRRKQKTGKLCWTWGRAECTMKLGPFPWDFIISGFGKKYSKCSCFVQSFSCVLNRILPLPPQKRGEVLSTSLWPCLICFVAGGIITTMRTVVIILPFFQGSEDGVRGFLPPNLSSQ